MEWISLPSAARLRYNSLSLNTLAHRSSVKHVSSANDEHHSAHTVNEYRYIHGFLASFTYFNGSIYVCIRKSTQWPSPGPCTMWAKTLLFRAIFKKYFIANLLLNLSMQEFWKSVSIWRCYGQKSSVLFLVHSVYMEKWSFDVRSSLVGLIRFIVDCRQQHAASPTVDPCFHQDKENSRHRRLLCPLCSRQASSLLTQTTWWTRLIAQQLQFLRTKSEFPNLALSISALPKK